MKQEESTPEWLVSEYSYTKRWRIIAWLCFIGLLGGAVALFYGAFTGVRPMGQIVVSVSCGAFFVVLSLLGMWEQFKAKVIIGKDRIISIGIFRTKILFFSDIKGVRMDKGLHFIPVDSHKHTISFSQYYREYAFVAGWAFSRFADLDRKESVKEWLEIASDKNFGADKRERINRAKRLKKQLKPLNVLAWIMVALVLFFPNLQYDLLITICAILPWIALVIYLTTKGLAKIYTEDNSPYPSLGSLTFMMLAVLGLRAVWDEEVMSYAHFWMPFAILSVVMFALFMCHEWKYRSRKFAFYAYACAVLFFSVGYSHSVIVLYNDILDHSNPMVYRTVVKDKYISGGKTRTHNLILAPWGEQTEDETTNVSRSLYNKVNEGDTVSVKVYGGRFGLPYYYISLE